MTRRAHPTPLDDVGADLEPVWNELADHAAAAPHAGAELRNRVQGALMAELERSLKATPQRSLVLVRPFVRPASLRSLAAAAALVTLLGAGVALASVGVVRLQERPAATPSPAVEQAPVAQPPVQPNHGNRHGHGKDDKVKPDKSDKSDKPDKSDKSDKPDTDKGGSGPGASPGARSDRPDGRPANRGNPKPN